MILVYDEQLHNFNFVPGFRLLPLIPFHSRKFSILIPGYFLEMVQSESPLCTVCIFAPAKLTLFEAELPLFETLLETITGFLEYRVNRWPTRRLLLLNPFHLLI